VRATDQPRGRKSLEELFARFDEAEDFEGAFLEQILEGAAERDPELPDLLRAGAIPRMLNAEIVGVLRDSADDTEGNRRLLELVAGYRFVLPRSDGGFVYHDNTREAFLADWRATDDKRTRFEELNWALAAFYDARYDDSRHSDRNLAQVSALIVRANPKRQRRLTRAVEARMAGSLLEALHHRLLVSPGTGVEFFKTSFYDLEETNRVGVCRSLISSTRDFLQRLPPDESEPTLLAWLEYFDARLEQRVPGYEAARVEAVLRRLLDSKELPPDLQTWALDDLADVYEAQLKIDDALRTRLELVEQRIGVDVYNDPIRHSSFGNLYWWLGDYWSAVRQLQLAVDKADEDPEARSDMGVLARLDLSGVYGDLGHWVAAFEMGIEALYRARTSFAQSPSLQRHVAARLGHLLSTFDLRASDCAAAETIAIVEGRPDERVAALVNRVDVLFNTGRIQSARAAIVRLEAELGESDRDSSVRLDLAYRRAKLSRREGRYEEANAAYSAVLEESAGRPGAEVLRLGTLESRGSIRALLNDTAGAVADLTATRDEWLRCGCRIDAAGTEIELADALSKAGDLTAARAFLDSADASVPPGVSENRAILLRVRGDLCVRVGDWPEAESHYEQALDILTARRQFEHQAELLRKLATAHAERSDWSLSAEYDRRSSVAIGELAAADAFNATGEDREAETDNARGMRSFCDVDDRTIKLERARQLFDSAAQHDPENFWPLLNLVFTYVEQQDWQGATETLEKVLDLCPAPMRTARLYGCLRDYVLEYARELSTRGDAGEAAEIMAGVLDRLSGELPPAELAQIQAVYCVLLASSGDGATAREAFTAAQALANGERSVVESMTPLIAGVEDYWALDHVLEEVQEDPSVSALSDAAAATRASLGFRLDEILGLTRDESAQEIPVVTPIVVEVGDGLVPIVDSNQDGGVFLYELIPAMRERILATTGVEVPGVRLRGNPGLPMGGYNAQVDEVPVLAGSAVLDTSFAVRPAEGGAPEPGGELTDFHPLTGEPGLWVLVEDTSRAGTDGLTTVQYLIHQIEMVFRAHLARYLGPQEVDGLVAEWSGEDDDGLVASVLPDAEARLRLTWVLQALVEDGVPITDWRSLLAAVRDAGGIMAPTRALVHGVRARLRDELPGPRTGKRVIPVPGEHEAALLGQPDGSAAAPTSQPEHAFLRWLRETVAVSGPAVTLVTGSQDARELVSALAHAEHRLITTLAEDELRPA
jgi:tetratricopeptide (TPR) repeat protein